MAKEETPYSELAPMAKEAKEELLKLFSEDRQEMWNVCYPSSNSSRSPPSGKSFEVISLGLVSKQMQNICEGVLKEAFKELEELFSLLPKGRSTSLHNSSVWDRFLHQLSFILSAGIVLDPKKDE